MMRKTPQPGLLWSIDRVGCQTSFVCGTMHASLPQGHLVLRAARLAIDRCTAFAAEIDLDRDREQEVGQLMLYQGMTIQDLLSPARFRDFKKEVQRVGIPLLAVVRLLPVMCTSLFTGRYLSMNDLKAVDEVLWAYAREGDKRLYGLESSQLQVQLLRSIPLKQQIAELIDLLTHRTQTRSRIRNLARLYEQGDLFRLHRAVRRGAGKSRRWLIDDRNAVMSVDIHRLALRHSICCAVGAGHLWGGNGILRLLKHKGWKVKDVSHGIEMSE